MTWNNRRIRNSRNVECPDGRTDYFIPAAAVATDYKFTLDQALRFCIYPSLVNFTEDFLSLALLVMTEENLKAPKNIQKTKSLF